MDLVGGEDILPHRRRHRIEQPGSLADPVAQCGAIQLNPFAGEDLGLPIQRQVIDVFADQQVRQRGRGRPAARGGHRRGRGLGDRVAGGAGEFGADVTDDPVMPGHVVQRLGDILAEPGHPLAAGRAGAGPPVGGLMHHLLARQMVGQRIALGLRTPRARRRGVLGLRLRGVLGLGGLQILQPQLELLDLARQPLRRAAELHSPQPRELDAQLLDLQRLDLHRRLGRAQLRLARLREDAQCGRLARQCGGGEGHAAP
jgi:hypothetical protein